MCRRETPIVMTGSARLLGLRVQGFKSFAERTVVEFGGGVSAVVGPNGSGKSNLADALRWTLGEQGRSLRTRKSEDVIFAGSETRAALGMADVTLVLDNSDGLLPVEYSVLELGRRLYRSGESDYLLNRQRVRLRDLLDLLDAAHLADNAFLFIGQGMVDQALALRPEERRPLFEEVAGVRRHDRRRRKAEEQLAEAEANLARVEDILAELRPQARRLAAQAEQQATRESAGQELAAALTLAAHARWHDAAGRASVAQGALERLRSDADAALGDLQEAESAAGAIASRMETRAAGEQQRRSAYEAVRDEVGALRVREARIAGDLEAQERERQRAENEREAALRSLAARRRELARPPVLHDSRLEEDLSRAERALAEALAELTGLQAARDEEGQERAALLREQTIRSAEADATRRRLSDAERRATEQRTLHDDARTTSTERAARLAQADLRLEQARSREAEATAAGEQALRSLHTAEAHARIAEERRAGIQARLATTLGGLEALRARLAEEEARGIARAARRRGGRRLDEGLEIDAAFRRAVEAALGETSRAYFVARETVRELAPERGILAVPATDSGVPNARQDSGVSPFIARLAELGGGRLGAAIRRDPTGAVARILDRVAWLPDLDSAVEAQPSLPPGWLAVTLDGAAVVGISTVALGRADGSLERRADESRLAAEADRLKAEALEHEATATAAGRAVEAARRQVENMRADEAAAARELAGAEAEQRVAAREAESAARELAWHAAQAERHEAELERLRLEMAELTPAPAGRADSPE